MTRPALGLAEPAGAAEPEPLISVSLTDGCQQLSMSSATDETETDESE